MIIPVVTGTKEIVIKGLKRNLEAILTTKDSYT
jgi:hypothetical protein